jgi:hypothetical protein
VKLAGILLPEMGKLYSSVKVVEDMSRLYSAPLVVLFAGGFPAAGTLGDVDYMASFGFEIMIFAGFLLMIGLGVLLYWLGKRIEHHSSHRLDH